MSMGAITQEYGPAEAAVQSVLAGVDMILIPEDFDLALSGLINAVEEGKIAKGRIHESLVRILQAKLKAGMIHMPT